MAEHRVKKNDIIYVIPDDELFAKWKNGEAFIDEYGRLINRKPHRVLRELKHYADKTPIVLERTVTPLTAPVEKSPYIKEHLKDAIRDKALEVGESIFDWAFDKFFYEVLPNVWHEHIVPFYYRKKAELTSKELKADTVLTQAKTNTVIATKPKAGTEMTPEEVDIEKRKVLYHWLGMLNSLKKLQDAGEIDIDLTVAHLTDPVMLERVNSYLSENPNLLETDKYILLHGLLGRDLYAENQLIPIKEAEITTIAKAYGYETKTMRPEENNNE